MVSDFDRRGWVVFPPEETVIRWLRHARADALRALSDPVLAHWFQCEGTWFVGLDVLANDTQGCVGGSDRLVGAAMAFLSERFGRRLPLHKGQVSGVFPGYPKPRAGESDAAFRYRRNRDAAHVDGVIGVGAPKRRFVQEPHAYILGLPLSEASAGAAPLVVWEGSHLLMREAFAEAFSTRDPASLADVDVTEIYQAARNKAFETCRRVVVHGAPGSAYVVHRLALHGVAPWAEGATAAPEGRLIAYFRPPMPGGAAAWTETL
jgi:hypothetical protein